MLNVTLTIIGGQNRLLKNDTCGRRATPRRQILLAVNHEQLGLAPSSVRELRGGVWA
jgi:hypothetical protein